MFINALIFSVIVTLLFVFVYMTVIDIGLAVIGYFRGRK